jgi:hypothetical protein
MRLGRGSRGVSIRFHPFGAITMTREELAELIRDVQTLIDDDFLAFDDDDQPGIQLTVASEDDGIPVAYQTGDNSFSGACYGYPYWAVVGVYADSDALELADDLISELAELIAQ